jgi:hypothetical protein
VIATTLLAMLPALALAAKPAPRVVPSASNGPKKPELTILYGDDHAFGIVAPAGWVVDDSSGMGSKIRVVLYPAGQKWASAPTVMYVNPLHQSKGSSRTLQQMIQQDVAAFTKQSPKGKVTTQPSLRTAKDQVAEVRYFAPTGGEPVEAVAYVAEEDLVMLLVLASREPAEFRRQVPAFRALVAGYQFVAGGIQTPP